MVILVAPALAIVLVITKATVIVIVVVIARVRVRAEAEARLIVLLLMGARLYIGHDFAGGLSGHMTQIVNHLNFSHEALKVCTIPLGFWG